MTKTDHHETLTGIARNVAACNRALKQLADTCCMVPRSEHMRTLTREIEALDLMAKAAGEADRNAGRAIARVGEIGSALGKLYATCCTPTREKLYIRMFKSLGDIHLGFRKIKGVPH